MGNIGSHPRSGDTDSDSGVASLRWTPYYLFRGHTGSERLGPTVLDITNARLVR